MAMTPFNARFVSFMVEMPSDADVRLNEHFRYTTIQQDYALTGFVVLECYLPDSRSIFLTNHTAMPTLESVRL